MNRKQEDTTGGAHLIASLNKQIFDLKKQVQSASLEMAMLRAQMDDLKKDADRSVHLQRFMVPGEMQMEEINETVSMLEKAINKERRRNRSSSSEKEEAASPCKLDERMILIVLKLRRKAFTLREIAAHTGLGVGTVHGIISRYGADPDIQNLVTGGTQLELSDYLLIKGEE